MELQLKSIDNLTKSDIIEIALYIILHLIWPIITVLILTIFPWVKDFILLGINNIKSLSLESVFGFIDWASILVVLFVAIVLIRSICLGSKMFIHLIFGQLCVVYFDNNTHTYITREKAQLISQHVILLAISNQLTDITDILTNANKITDNDQNEKVLQE